MTIRKFLLPVFLMLGLGGCQTAAVVLLNTMEVTELEVKDNKLYIANVLNSKTLNQLQRVMAENPEVDTLVFTAMEGSIDDETTFQLGRWIRKQGLNTHLTARSAIASGAVDLYVSGVVRTMEQGAQVGVHSWSDGSKQAIDFPRDHKAHDLNKNYIVDMGVPEAFYWFTIEAAPADQIYWMTELDILRFQLTSAPLTNTDSSSKIPFYDFNKQRKSILTE